MNASAADVSKAELWRLCDDDVYGEDRPIASDKLEFGTTSVDADEIEITREGVTTLSGHVEAHHNENTLYADHLIYDENISKLDVHGNVKFWTEGLYWHGEQAAIDRQTNISSFHQGDYRLLQRRGHGNAEKVIDEPDTNTTYLTNVDYTTCPGGPDDVAAWRLKAKDLKLDHEANWGRALHTFLKIKDVPVFYLPYITFPLTDERMTGLLPPTFGATKDSGFDIRTPVYWNIAPDKDATITPRVLSDRGFMLGTEFRYLRPTGTGKLELEYLPSDNLRANHSRYLFGMNITEFFADRRGRVYIDFNQASDKEYFEDLSTSIDVTSQRLLDRRADVFYRSDLWSVLGRIQSYQSVDNSLLPQQQPYDRLPQFYFRTHLPQRNKRLNFFLGAESVYFDRDNSITGNRFDLVPEINFPIRNAGSFIIPRLKLRHTQYLVDRQDNLNDTPGRTLPIFSVDSGLFFEKDLQLGQTDYLHTLEPRLFYLYTPETDQSDIPIFDTGQFDTSFAQLFLDNRFNAADRVGDANQLTVALTSRLVDRHTGRERFTASIGQIQYFRDREVTLPGRPVETTRSSAIVAQLGAQVTNHLRALYDVEWDPHLNLTKKSSLNIRYQPQRNTVFNIGYRMRKDLTDIEQTDVSFRWPINQNWSTVGRWNYSLQNDRTIESLLGFEYNSCCWATRVVARHFLRNTEGEYDDAIFFQFELKGLAGFGRGTRDFLQRNIPGYHYEF